MLMATTFDDEMRVTFPASPNFSAIGRVTAAGLAFRLGYEVAQVESLRLAVEHVTTAISSSGTIELCCRWTPTQLELELSNVSVALSASTRQELDNAGSTLLTEARFNEHSVILTIERT